MPDRLTAEGMLVGTEPGRRNSRMHAGTAEIEKRPWKDRRREMIDRLVEAIRRTNAPICVGLDPQMSFIPEDLKKKAFIEFGQTLEGAAEAIWQFNKAIIDAVCDLVPAVKPQIAMYEMFGIPGLQAFARTVEYCRGKGLIVIGDVKRGDIGSTSAAYAAGSSRTGDHRRKDHSSF